ncbi:hypothetical protein GDO81_018914 [Engystomops pustulosus]|uniref:Uncharacterized protein n=1 Tax=Engystomops pustulosus TaxID=76066 RepID=A0AAV6YUM0_ENGPU|nr:hypothetical protein GDO81_018914 [Engystomops pustulosus]
MEEWDYIEGHKDQYEDLIMEHHQTFLSPDESSKVLTTERFSNRSDPLDDPVTNHLNEMKDETITDEAETYADVSPLCVEEESPADISAEESGQKNPPPRSPSLLCSQSDSQGNQNVQHNYQVQRLVKFKDDFTMEEEYAGGTQQCKEEESPRNISSGE